MTNSYRYEKTEDLRWGIYLEDRLLATVGTKEECHIIGSYLNKKVSDALIRKSAKAYQKALLRKKKPATKTFVKAN